MRKTACSLVAFVLLSLGMAAPGAAEQRGERLLHQMGKSLALSLAKEEMRARLHKLLGETPYVEGRVALKRLLAEDSALRSKLLGKAAGDWSAASAVLPELELYFPSKEHRSSWAGEPAIDVAVPLGKSGRYRVYSPDGSVRDISGGDRAPETPTLLLGRSEIDYDDAESAMVGGRRTGPVLERLAKELAKGCDKKAAPGGIASIFGNTNKAADTGYETSLIFMRIKNDYEPWIRGSMEIEVFGNVDGGYHGCTRISDVDEDRDYHYTLGARKVAEAAPTGSSFVNLSLYEDDDSGCSVQSGDDFIGGASQSEGQVGFRQNYTNFDVTLQKRAQPVCNDNRCDPGESIFSCCECNSCGDALCNTNCGENYSSCYYDCSCGDFYCDFHEDNFSCPQDCTCGNGFCDFNEDRFNCPQDCTCGNGVCDFGESNNTCPQDCPF